MQNEQGKMLISVDDYNREVMGFIEKKVSKHIVQIFLPNENDDPDSRATGCLLDYHEEKYLITAAHAIYESSNVLIPCSGLTEPIKAEKIKATSRQKDRLDAPQDQYDFAVFRLSDDSTAMLLAAQYEFVPGYLAEKDFVFNSQKLYFFFGYPCSRTKEYIHNKLRASPLFYWGLPETAQGLPKIYNERVHHFLSYPIKDTMVNDPHGPRMISNAPKLVGVSGTALWYVKDPVINDTRNPEYRLIGIIIEEFPKNKNQGIVVATRIEHVLSMIDQHMSTTNE